MIRGTICFTLIATFGSLMACDEPLYIGNDPSMLIRLGGPKDSSPDPGDDPANTDGTCLLAYNSALVESGADECCYYQGQENLCNTAAQCNELSGGYCCLIYGTENTAGGGRCCLYEGGRFGDGAAECKALLSNAPAGGPVALSPSDCLLEYNTALVSEGADACCYHQGQQNQCSRAVKCNELSGASCCLIYGTENTAGGARCCWYENGRFGDGAAECKTLLSTAAPAN